MLNLLDLPHVPQGDKYEAAVMKCCSGLLLVRQATMSLTSHLAPLMTSQRAAGLQSLVRSHLSYVRNLPTASSTTNRLVVKHNLKLFRLKCSN